ncbi:peptidase C14 caspase catalytic subunit p20 [Arthrobacter sp. SW1]|uniref:caspase family protein n=1 Tax=Arthrobacter sp. SW1 TaxID=1920889 RepID=UPI000877DF1A|nr:caspase family protein [Arthrobacter sp. SW1]OFI39856.1 peptidase C14 caspase catalytic subunit p20 [Arthrobacter sp. SW1]
MNKSSNKAALCVGINEFKFLPQSSWLQGCVNDANDLSGLLEGKYGFPASGITVLHDAGADKDAVMAELSKLMDLAVTGTADHLVFTFSSHGTQIPDASADEADRLDEAFACYGINNTGDAWDPATVIADDELYGLFSKLPDGVLFEVVLDTCHSGTGLKSLDLLPGRRPRFVPAPTPRAVAASEYSDTRVLRDLVKAGGDSKPVLMAACRADQTAADAYLEKRYNGAFTYNLVKALEADGTLPRADILKAVSKGLKAGGFDQVAQLEASTAARKAAWGTPG